MPWKECKPMDERLRFIARLLEGENMAPFCREFGISRVTGYKIYNRYRDSGLDGLNRAGRSGMLPGTQVMASWISNNGDYQEATTPSEQVVVLPASHTT